MFAVNSIYADQESCKSYNAEVMKHISQGASVTGSASKFSIECVDLGGNNFVGKITKDELDSLTLAQVSKIMKSVKNCAVEDSSGSGGSSGTVSAKVKGRAIASAGSKNCANAFSFIQHHLADKAGVGSDQDRPCAKDSEDGSNIVKASGNKPYRPKPVPILDSKNPGVMGPLVPCSHYTRPIPCQLCEAAGGTCY